MNKIPLTQGMFAVVDDEEYVALSKYRWCVTKTHGNVYAVRNSPRPLGHRKLILMHRDIMGDCNGKPTIDHANGDTLDNRRSNLRFATYAENNVNRPCNRTNASGFRGVGWYSLTKRWRCTVGHKHLGYFRVKEDAARKYNEEAKRIYGDFARLNAA